jgi:FkbM family methyltransferase
MPFFLTIGLFFWGIYNAFLAFLLNARKNSLIMLISIAGMILSVILNFFLVRRFGALGATYTSIIVYFVMAVTTIYFVNKFYSLRKIFSSENNLKSEMSFIKESAYKLLDIMTLGKGVQKNISGFSVRLPVRYARYFPENYEQDNFDFLKKHCPEGGVVIDIGAHIGLFAVRAAQLTRHTGKVYAFEPTPNTQKLLQGTIALNKMHDSIIPRKEAVAEKDGVTYFYVSDNEGDNSNSLVGYREDKELHKTEVELTSIDSFVRKQNLTRIDFIKIDAEGYEYNVLKGAEETFLKFRPKAILALHPDGIRSNGNFLEEIYDLLKKLNYQVVFEEKELSRAEFSNKANLFDVHLIPS